jgi:hypothetical protein
MFVLFFLVSCLLFFFCYLEYQKAWEELRVPMPEKALHLSLAEGLYRPYCYTNFQPHFNPKYRLENLILGNSTWVPFITHHDDQYAHEAGKYGYQDTRPSYEVHLSISFLSY